MGIVFPIEDIGLIGVFRIEFKETGAGLSFLLFFL